MRLALLLAASAALLSACASNEYSKVPEPTGEWVPANPPSLMVDATPARLAALPIAVRWRGR